MGLTKSDSSARRAVDRADILKRVEVLEQEIIRLNDAACRKDFEAGGLTPNEFTRLPEVQAKEEAMKRLDSLIEILHKFFAPERSPEEAKAEVLY